MAVWRAGGARRSRGAANDYATPSPTLEVFDLNGNFVKEIKLPTRSAHLATGQSISYSFSL